MTALYLPLLRYMKEMCTVVLTDCIVNMEIAKQNECVILAKRPQTKDIKADGGCIASAGYAINFEKASGVTRRFGV